MYEVGSQKSYDQGRQTAIIQAFQDNGWKRLYNLSWFLERNRYHIGNVLIFLKILI